MEKKIPVKTLYLLSVISFGLIALGLGSTYAIFTASAEISNPIAFTSNLSYDSDIVEAVEVTVPAGKTISTTFNVTNNSDEVVNYVSWYLGEGQDIDIGVSSGTSAGSLASGSSTNMVLSIRNKSTNSISVILGVSSSSGNIVLSENMRVIDSFVYLMSVADSQTETSTFLRSELKRNQISSVTFVDNINIPTDYTSVDVSYAKDNSVIMWYGTPNGEDLYDIYIGSNGGILTIKDGSRLFSQLVNASSIDFNNLVNTSGVTSMYYMFGKVGYNSNEVNISDLSNWDTSSVTDMRVMFSELGYKADKLNINNLDNWDTSSVTNMMQMFFDCGYNATEWNVGDLSKWNTGSVKDMSLMFDDAGFNAETFNIGNLDNWDTSKVTTMYGMFNHTGENATVFNIGNLDNWNTGSVTDMAFMFAYQARQAKTWNIGTLSNWNTSNVTSMEMMFHATGQNTKDFSLDLSKWNTGSVTDMNSMFAFAGNNSTMFNIGNLDNWNTSNVKIMDDMFAEAGLGDDTWELNLSTWDVRNVTSYIGFSYNVEDRITLPTYWVS